MSCRLFCFMIFLEGSIRGKHPDLPVLALPYLAPLFSQILTIRGKKRWLDGGKTREICRQGLLFECPFSSYLFRYAWMPARSRIAMIMMMMPMTFMAKEKRPNPLQSRMIPKIMSGMADRGKTVIFMIAFMTR